MAKAQAIKPKSSIADWFKRAPKKAAARPGGSPQSTTLTNIPVHVNDIIFGQLSGVTEEAPARNLSAAIVPSWRRTASS